MGHFAEISMLAIMLMNFSKRSGDKFKAHEKHDRAHVIGSPRYWNNNNLDKYKKNRSLFFSQSNKFTDDTSSRRFDFRIHRFIFKSFISDIWLNVFAKKNAENNDKAILVTFM